MQSERGRQEEPTVIAEGTELQGRLRSASGLAIRGTVEGEVEAPVVSVAPTGRLTGTARVQELRSEGHICGRFEAENVTLAGTVGDETTIRARTLEARLSGDGSHLEVSFGSCVLEVGDPPSAAPIDESSML